MPSAARLPVVLTRDEVRALLRQLTGTPRMMAILLYGSGLRLLECARLRVKDVDFGRNQIVVRAGTGNKDRTTTFPALVRTDLACHLESVKTQHELNLRRRRHHLHESVLQRAIKDAVRRAGILKRATSTPCATPSQPTF